MTDRDATSWRRTADRVTRCVAVAAAAWAAWLTWRAATDVDLTLAEWRVAVAWVTSIWGFAGMVAVTGARFPGRPFLSLALSVAAMLLVVEPARVLDADSRRDLAGRTWALSAYDERVHVVPSDPDAAARRCHALQDFVLHLHDRVRASRSGGEECVRGEPGNVPAAYDRWRHLPDVFVGGEMRVLPLPEPPVVAPEYRA